MTIQQGDWFSILADFTLGTTLDHYNLAGDLLDRHQLDTLLGYHAVQNFGIHIDGDAQLWLLHTNNVDHLTYIAHLDENLALVGLSPSLPFVVSGVDYEWLGIGGNRVGQLVAIAVRADDITGDEIDFTLLVIDKATWATTEINGLDSNSGTQSWVAFDCDDNKVYYSEVGSEPAGGENINRIYVYNLSTLANEPLYYEESSLYTFPAAIVCPGAGQLIVAFPDFGPGAGLSHGPYETMALASDTALWAGEVHSKNVAGTDRLFYRRYNAVTGGLEIEVEQANSPDNLQRPYAMGAFFDACAVKYPGLSRYNASTGGEEIFVRT